MPLLSLLAWRHTLRTAAQIAAFVIVCAVVGFSSLVAMQRRRPRVLCLMYHRIASREAYRGIKGTERIYTVPVDTFDEQIAYLKSQGFKFLTCEEMRAYAAGETVPHHPSVLITFDDGCRSILTLAAPVLEKHGACGTAFVTLDPKSYIFEKGDGRLSDDEIRASDGKTLYYESHAITHRALRSLDDEELRYELVESRARLERLLGRDVRFITYPSGYVNQRVVRATRAAGYRAGWCSVPGVTRPGMEPIALPRVNVEGHLTTSEFAAAISARGIAKRMVASQIKRMPGRVLGPRRWEPLRKLVMSLIPGGYISTSRVLGAACLAVAVVTAIVWWVF